MARTTRGAQPDGNMRQHMFSKDGQKHEKNQEHWKTMENTYFSNLFHRLPRVSSLCGMPPILSSFDLAVPGPRSVQLLCAAPRAIAASLLARHGMDGVCALCY